MPRMAFLQDIALRARPAPLHPWPEVAEEEQDGEIGQEGAGNQYHVTHDNVVSTGTPDAATVQPRTKSSVGSPLAALGMYGRAVSGLAMSTRDRNGGAVTGTMCSGLLPPGLHDARGGGHERQRQPWLWLVVKSLVIATTLVAAVVVIANQGTAGDGGAKATSNFAPLAPFNGGRLRSESINSFSSPTTEDSEPFTVAAASTPVLAASSPQQYQSRSLGDAVMTVNTASGDGTGDGGSSALGRRARVGYLIMLSGVEELQKTKRLLKAIYDPNNFYLVHLDRKDTRAVRTDLEKFIEDWNNVRMLVPALDVSWGGYTITLTAIFGICSMVQWSDEWDFFINLSASDFPLLPQSELTAVLGQYADVGMNFVSGAPLNERNRVEVLIDDQGLYRETQTSKAGRPLKVAKARLPPSKSMFTVYKGEFWVILHRSFCRYIEASPDNVARSLQAYFSRFRISDESYFQTVLCHPLAPSFRVHPDNLRFVSWPPVSEGHYVLHPDPITGGVDGNVNVAMESGALFARKFDLEVSQEAYAVVEESLSESKPGRQARAANRLSPAGAVTGRQRFCAIPEGYNIQEVLSRPPKKAWDAARKSKSPDKSPDNDQDHLQGNNNSHETDPQQQQPVHVQTREAREGDGGSKL
eukprot:g17744.t1